MNPKIAIVGIIIVVALALVFTPSLLELFAVEDYGTGLDANVDTVVYEQTRPYQGRPGALWQRDQTTTDEIFPYDKYVVAWQPDAGQSGQAITMEAEFEYNPTFGADWVNRPLGVYQPGQFLGRYGLKIYYTDLSGTETLIVDTVNANWDTKYIASVEYPPDVDYVDSVGHLFPIAGGDYHVWPYMEGGLQYKEYTTGRSRDAWPSSPYDDWSLANTHTFVWRMIGNKPGKLRAEFSHTDLAMVEMRSLPFNLWDAWWHNPTALIATDECYLVDGTGKVDITSTNSIENLGWVTTSETNINYVKYLYEEGGTVKFEVTTGYSGDSLPSTDPRYGLGWTLEVHDSTGARRDSWDIPDGQVAYPVSYPIPEDAWISNDPNDNEWTVVLKNTMFVQQETRIFVIDTYEKMPLMVRVDPDKSSYIKDETCYVTMIGNRNPDTQIPITKFKAWAVYDSPYGAYYAHPETDYIGLSVTDNGDGSYSCSYSFNLPLGDRYIYVWGTCFDSESRPSNTLQTVIYVEDKPGQYRVAITVTDASTGTPVDDVKIVFGDRTVYTDRYGEEDVYLAYGSYDLAATKDGYQDYSQSGILVNSNMELRFSMSKTGVNGDDEYDMVSIIIAIVIFAISAVIAWVAPVPGGIYGKLIIVILGAVLAAVVYLFLGGMI